MAGGGRAGLFFFFSSRRRHTRLQGDWSSDVCSSDLRLLELAVNRERAADEAHGARPGPELVEGAFARGDDLRRVAQTEVVVGGEDHDLAAPLHLASCGLRPLEVVEALVDSVLLELLEFTLEPDSEGHAISRMILPASPARMAARASSILASGNWGVITGRGSSSPAVR